MQLFFVSSTSLLTWGIDIMASGEGPFEAAATATVRSMPINNARGFLAELQRSCQPTSPTRASATDPRPEGGDTVLGV